MRRKHRAIALIATMVAAVAVAMVITAALMLVPGQLDNSVHTRERELAQQAALSGLEYALNRLRSDLPAGVNTVGDAVNWMQANLAALQPPGA